MISVAEANVISIVPDSRSLTAKAMIYRLAVDRRFVFLYAAIQIRLFPMMLVMFNETHAIASVMTADKLRLDSSKLNIALKIEEIKKQIVE